VNKIIFLIILLIFNLLNAFTQEITKIKCKFDGFYDYLVYPIDKNNESNYGFLHISINDGYFQDKTIDDFKNIISYNLIRNTVRYYHSSKMYSVSSIINGIIGISFNSFSIICFSFTWGLGYYATSLGGIVALISVPSLIVFFIHIFYAAKFYKNYKQGEKIIIEKFNVIKLSKLNLKLDLKIATN